eukprot:2667271-Amphidinium_carterae.1
MSFSTVTFEVNFSVKIVNWNALLGGHPGEATLDHDSSDCGLRIKRTDCSHFQVQERHNSHL